MSDGDVISLPVQVRHGEVLRFLGYPEDRVPKGHIDAMIDEAIVVGRRLARAVGAFVYLPVQLAGEVGLAPIEAAGLAIGLVTAGGAVETRVAGLMDSGDVAGALLLDAVGSAVAEEAADLLSAQVAGPAAGSTAVDVPCRLSPGYGDWPLSAQPLLFKRLPHRALGIELLPSLLMLPRKSISFAMWLGATDMPAQGRAGCARCALPHCRYRRAAPAR
jgi:hypothetical protein